MRMFFYFFKHCQLLYSLCYSFYRYKNKGTAIKRPKQFDFDLIVLGSGAGGNAATHVAAMMGKRVAVVEPGRLGGDCANYGCVPTKSLLQAADVMLSAQTASKFGVRTGEVSFDYKSIKSWMNHAVNKTDHTESEHFHHDKSVVYLKGYGKFISRWEVEVGTKIYSARKFLIATGTKNMTLPIPGLKDAGYITYKEAINLENLPKSIFIIGGGAVGCEFAHFFRVFGTKVYVADMAPRISNLEDPEIGYFIEDIFERKGIKVFTSANINWIEKTPTKKIVHFEQNEKLHQISVDEIMVSSGKAPATDIGLGNAGIQYDKKGILVNRYLQTSAKNIYAAGDIIGPYRFTHTATYQSGLAGYNMFRRAKKSQVNYNSVPRCIFIDPEIACTGMTEFQLKEKNIGFQTAIVPITQINKAITSGIDDGFVKILAKPDGTLLGASIASPHAGEMIHELTLAIQYKMRASQIVKTIHAFPTWSEAVRLACQQLKSK